MTYSAILRGLAIAAGLGVVGVGASVTLSHVHEPDQRALVVAMASGAAFASFILPMLWRDNRWLALLALLGILVGEAYGFAQTVERQLGVREERARALIQENQPRVVLQERVKRLGEELKTANQAVLDEAGKGGCKSACQAKQREAADARARLEQAERDLASAPALRQEARLATKLGVSQDLIDIALAGAVATALFAFQIAFLAIGHGRKREEEASQVAVPDAAPVAKTRHEEAAEFARAYLAKHGKPPAWAEVHKAGFSAATASRALRLVSSK